MNTINSYKNTEEAIKCFQSVFDLDKIKAGKLITVVSKRIQELFKDYNEGKKDKRGVEKV